MSVFHNHVELCDVYYVDFDIYFPDHYVTFPLCDNNYNPYLILENFNKPSKHSYLTLKKIDWRVDFD